VLHRVQAARLARILEAVGADLALEALVGPALLLELGVEVDARVGIRLAKYLRPELEILEDVILDVADIEEMAAVAVGDDLAVLDLEGLGAFVGLPARQVLAVEEGDESLLLVLGNKGHEQGRDDQMFHGSFSSLIWTRFVPI